MKTLKKVTGILAVLVGAFFILSMASDIQLGFGLVLIVQGLTIYE